MDRFENACNEYRQLSRRKFLGGAAAMSAMATLPVWAPRLAFAQDSSIKDTVVLIYLMGGCDGLTTLVPHGDPLYYALRPTTAVPQPGSGSSYRATDIDGYWGLPPALSLLKPIFDGQHLGIIPAVGRANYTRSHFEAQAWMQLDSKNVEDGGWIARHLLSSSPIKPNAAVRAFTHSALTPLCLAGAPQLISSGKPESLGLGGNLQGGDEVLDSITRIYSRVKDETRHLVQNARRTIDTFSGIDFEAPAVGANPYEDTELGNALKHIASMIKADIGLEIAHVSRAGWDTHAGQGTNGGLLHVMLSELGNALHTFYHDLTNSGKTNWTVVVISEFGRQVAENGSFGTDHGTGGTVFTMGPNVIGGIHGTWPGLHHENLYEGVDVMPTTDDRDILGDLLQCRLQNGNTQLVFPSKTIPSQPQGFFKAA